LDAFEEANDENITKCKVLNPDKRCWTYIIKGNNFVHACEADNHLQTNGGKTQVIADLGPQHYEQ
jgi:hypothetical protein